MRDSHPPAEASATTSPSTTTRPSNEGPAPTTVAASVAVPSFVVERIDADVHVFRIDRTARLNALTREVLDGLSETLTKLEAGAGRALIIIGTGDRAFCAGTDLNEIRGMDAAARLAKNTMARTLMFRLSQSRILSIAALNGLAFGGGLELAMACTFRIALPHAKVSLPEIKLGLIPAYGGTQFLPAMVGRDRALEMMLTGRAVTMTEALAMGLVTRIAHPARPLLDQAITFAGEFTCFGQLAIDAVRDCVAASGDCVDATGLAAEEAAVRRIFHTDDATEGVQAFLEKRAPVFRHR